jgi:adenine-specific DNA-methyltransferase
LELNEIDDGNRKFIVVQIPEVIAKNNYSTISEVCKERIRRVIHKINTTANNKLKFSEDTQDRGFRVYKLNSSNLKIWQDYKGNDVQAVQQSLLEFENRLVDGWTEERVITEVQLLEGFPLDSIIEEATKFTQNRVLCVTSEHIEHRLFICLDDKLNIGTVQEVRLLEDEDIFICLDNALTDQEKIWLADGCNVKTI